MVVASGNVDKIKEIRQIFSDYEIIPMKDLGYTEDIEETGETFAENAYIKAKAVAERYAIRALSDDSGLCVNALGGAPGVYSARYSGGGYAENRALLLKNMQGVTDRSAHFCCCVCICNPDGSALYAEGKTYGKITEREIGEGGFGYDSIFLSDDLGVTFAEAAPELKNTVSHRSRALLELRKKL